MAKMTLTLDEFSAAAGIDRTVVRKRREVGRLALAFGRDGPISPGRYCPLDVPPVCFTDKIAPTVGFDTAARVVREKWWIWLDAVRVWEWQMAECSDSTQEPRRIALFVGKRFMPGNAYFVSAGTLSEVAKKVEESGDAGLPQPATYVDIGNVLTDIRQRADAAGIDALKLPFFPPRDTSDQAGLKRLLAGIAEASALPEQLDAVARRHVIAVGQRGKRVWLQ